METQDLKQEPGDMYFEKPTPPTPPTPTHLHLLCHIHTDNTGLNTL